MQHRAKSRNLFGFLTKKTVTYQRSRGQASPSIRAYRAGVQSGDTGGFDSWLAKQPGIRDAGRSTIDRLEQQYRRGVERAGHADRVKEARKAKKTEKAEKSAASSGRGATYKGVRIIPSADGFKLSKIDRESTFDTVQDAKDFIRDSKQNPGCAVTRRAHVTDRAKRYRANQPGCLPSGKKECTLCAAKRDLMVDHQDGDEGNGDRSNLRWLCRSCNTLLGAEMARAGVGRRTDQYNPQAEVEGAKNIYQYMLAVVQHKRGSHDRAGKIIHATPPAKRREYAAQFWSARKAHARSHSDERYYTGNPSTKKTEATRWYQRGMEDARSGRHYSATEAWRTVPANEKPSVAPGPDYVSRYAAFVWARKAYTRGFDDVPRRASNPSLFDAIKSGSRVTIVDRFGKKHAGRAIMRGPAGWVLNMGGRHGVPAIASPENVVKVTGGGTYKELLEAGSYSNPNQEEFAQPGPAFSVALFDGLGRMGDNVPFEAATLLLAQEKAQSYADETGRDAMLYDDAGVSIGRFTAAAAEPVNNPTRLKGHFELVKAGHYQRRNFQWVRLEQGARPTRVIQDDRGRLWGEFGGVLVDVTSAITQVDAKQNPGRFKSVLEAQAWAVRQGRHEPFYAEIDGWPGPVLMSRDHFGKWKAAAGTPRSNPYNIPTTSGQLDEGISYGTELGRADAIAGKPKKKARTLGIGTQGQIGPKSLKAYKAAYSRSYDVTRAMMAAPAGRINPEQTDPGNADADYRQALTIAELFHGRAVKEEITVTEMIREHDWLWRIGPLVSLRIKALTGGTFDIPFSETEETTVHLFCSPDGKQFYLRGGDQELDLDDLGMGPRSEWFKDLMLIGEAKEITYQDQKKFHRFKLIDYYHKLGEVTRKKPMLSYNSLAKRLEILGGQYRVETKELVDGMSPGIVN